jgi:HSP20 family molecular chaperone IbpA
LRRPGVGVSPAERVVRSKAGSAERLKGASIMVRVTALSSPLLLGFDGIERALDKASKSAADGYPPYNIERIAGKDGEPEILRITLAVAGFTQDQVEVTQEENQLSIRGRQPDDKTREYIHRGIAARQFQRSFLLADGMQVRGAELANGLLSIDVARPQPERVVRKINVAARD